MTLPYRRCTKSEVTSLVAMQMIDRSTLIDRSGHEIILRLITRSLCVHFVCTKLKVNCYLFKWKTALLALFFFFFKILYQFHIIIVPFYIDLHVKNDFRALCHEVLIEALAQFMFSSACQASTTEPSSTNVIDIVHYYGTYEWLQLCKRVSYPIVYIYVRESLVVLSATRCWQKNYVYNSL